MNLLLIASVAVVACGFGRLPAVIYHDYGGTIIILLWFFFWWFCHGWLQDPLEELPKTTIEERYLKEIYPSGTGEEGEARPKGLKAVRNRLGAWIRRRISRRRSSTIEKGRGLEFERWLRLQLYP